MAKKVKSLKDLESLYDSGEAKGAPYGYRGQTANGTAQAIGTGWNKDTPIPEMPEVPAGGAWQGRRSSRTAE